MFSASFLILFVSTSNAVGVLEGGSGTGVVSKVSIFSSGTIGSDFSKIGCVGWLVGMDFPSSFAISSSVCLTVNL